MTEHDLDRVSEVFHDEADNDELLDQYARGFISKQEFADRAEFLLMCAEQCVEAEAREGVDCMEARKEQIETALVDGEVA